MSVVHLSFSITLQYEEKRLYTGTASIYPEKFVSWDEIREFVVGQLVSQRESGVTPSGVYIHSLTVLPDIWPISSDG